MHFVYGYKSSSEEFVEPFYCANPPNRAGRLPSDQLPMGFDDCPICGKTFPTNEELIEHAALC